MGTRGNISVVMSRILTFEVSLQQTFLKTKAGVMVCCKGSKLLRKAEIKGSHDRTLRWKSRNACPRTSLGEKLVMVSTAGIPKRGSTLRMPSVPKDKEFLVLKGPHTRQPHLCARITRQEGTREKTIQSTRSRY